MKFDCNTTLSCRIVPGSRAVRCVTLSLSIQYNKIRVSSEASPFTAREGPSTHQDLTGQGLISTTADEVDAASEITGRGWQRTTFGRHRYVATWLPTASKIRCPDRDKFKPAPGGAVKMPTLSLAGCKAPGPPGRTEKHPAPHTASVTQGSNAGENPSRQRRVPRIGPVSSSLLRAIKTASTRLRARSFCMSSVI
jgi:hypothetical protein